jgi:hypothetical protein
MAKNDLREWAVKGAEQRLVELAEEARTIFAAFPELRERGRGFEVGRGRKVATATVTPAKRRRKAMSPAARRKIALAQKKRWAEWRKKKGKAAQEGQPASKPTASRRSPTKK